MSTNIKNPDGSLTKIAGKTLQYPVNTNIGTSEVLQDAPVGHIISYMGTIIPAHYLACDGSIYNISDYPKLAEHFLANFGSKNYFGGDGTTTFGVPDLRGEFLRGAGTNSHTDGGNGSNVGTHQGGTSIPRFDVESNGTLISRCNTTKSLTFRNTDFGEISASSSNKYAGYNPSNVGTNNYYGEVGVRPTNTSVLYCIKAEPTYYMEIKDPGYSTDEVFTGKTWIDGKPIYRKVLTGKFGTHQVYNSNIRYNRTMLNLQFADIVTVGGYINTYRTDEGTSTTYKLLINSTALSWTTDGAVDKSCYCTIETNGIQLNFDTKYTSVWRSDNMDYVVIVEYTKTTD